MQQHPARRALRRAMNLTPGVGNCWCLTVSDLGLGLTLSKGGERQWTITPTEEDDITCQIVDVILTDKEEGEAP